MSLVTVTVQNGELAINAPYNKSFIEALKLAIPWKDRSWSSPHWIVLDKHRATVDSLIYAYYNQVPLYTDNSSKLQEPETVLLKVEYIGRCKFKDGMSVASAWVDGSWSVSFLESALRLFFQGDPGRQKIDDTNYYTILGVDGSATPDVLKKQYRRLARQWHPDVNHGDKDAEDMFRVINEAYEILSNPAMRRKYDFGLELAAQHDIAPPNHKEKQDDVYGYRPPMRCGYVLVDGTYKMGRLIVSKIHSWEDIIVNGKVMVVSWQYGDKSFTTHWM